MALKVKAQQRLMHVGKQAGKSLFIMTVDNYSTLEESKLFQEAAVHSGMSSGAIRAAWYACGDILRNWLTEGHVISIPGLGHMRFAINGKAVENIQDVSVSNIITRKILFTPSVEVKQALDNTAITITCYDQDGAVIKREEATEDSAA